MRPPDGPVSARRRSSQPRWLIMLRSLFCGLYTVDNMDFVLRDAYMSGYSQQAYDVDRLLRDFTVVTIVGRMAEIVEEVEEDEEGLEGEEGIEGEEGVEGEEGAEAAEGDGGGGSDD